MPTPVSRTKTVVHLSTNDKWGGAAIAAWRLHEGLQGLGVDSRIVCRRPSAVTHDVASIFTPLFEAADLLNENFIQPAQPQGASLFSLSPVSLPLLDHPWIAEADVIHLHWVAQFLAPEDIAELCKAGKTVFWTFHDQWPFTGGCHYIGGATRHESDWDGSAQIGPQIHPFAKSEWQRKKDAFKGHPIHVITPSRWMAEEAVASGVFSQEQIHVIPYGINTSVFYPSRFSETPQLADETYIDLVFGCQCVGDPRKGFKELTKALDLCMRDSRFAAAVERGLIRVRTFGELPECDTDLSVPVTHLGMLVGELKIAELLRATSAFICPTLEDNLPNVVMESLACGCPVVAFSTGGVPDMVTHQHNGLLAPKGNSEVLSQHLISFCFDKSLRQQLRLNAQKTDLNKWSLKAQATKVLELYDVVASTSSSKRSSNLPSCPATLTVDAKILPHFATEMAQMFLAAREKSESRYFAEVDHLNEGINRAQELVLQSDKHLLHTQQQFSHFREQMHQIDNERQLLTLQLSQIHNELELYFFDNRRLAKEIARTKVAAEKERLKSRQIKQQLSYRLGSQLVSQSRSVKGIIGMPLSLLRETFRFRKSLKGKQSQKAQDLHKKSSAENNRLSSHTVKGDAAAARVKEQLSYRVGSAFVKNASSPLGWIKLPFAVASEIIDFKRSRKSPKS